VQFVDAFSLVCTLNPVRSRPLCYHNTGAESNELKTDGPAMGHHGAYWQWPGEGGGATTLEGQQEEWIEEGVQSGFSREE